MDDEPPMLAGQALRDLLWALRQTLGDAIVDEGLAAAPPEARERYVNAHPVSWVSYEDVRAVHQAIADAGQTTMELMLERAVPVSVERSFKTVWRVFLRLTSDAQLLKRTPLLYSKTRSKGRMEADVIGRGKAVAEVTGWGAAMPSRDVRSLALSIETFLTLCGREQVVVRGAPTRDGARFDVRWLR